MLIRNQQMVDFERYESEKWNKILPPEIHDDGLSDYDKFEKRIRDDHAAMCKEINDA